MMILKNRYLRSYVTESEHTTNYIRCMHLCKPKYNFRKYTKYTRDGQENARWRVPSEVDR